MNMSVRFLALAALAFSVSCKSTYEQTNLIAPRLMRPLEFADFTVSEIHSQQGAIELMQKKIKVGSDDADAYDIFSKDGEGGKTIHVETVNEYRAAKKAGYLANNTFAITMEGWFKDADTMLDFMAKAQPSKHSYLDKRFLEQLPVTVLDWVEDEGKELKDDAAKGMTLKDYTTAKARRHVHIVKNSGTKMTFSDDACDYDVWEIARGDYDHDGCEDSLISINTYFNSGSGSGRHFNTFIVSKTDKDAHILSVVKAHDEEARNWIVTTKSAAGVPQEVFDNVKSKAASFSPSNNLGQKTDIKMQVKANLRTAESQPASAGD